MKLGIVGHEQAKFRSLTEKRARQAIHRAIDWWKPDALVSGHSPLGGVDWFAEEIAVERGLEMIVHAPRVHTWGGPDGYKARNLRIAQESDLVLCVALVRLPEDFAGMRFPRGCYHCKGRNPEHVKGGGCWTAWQCRDRRWAFISPGP